MARLLGAADVRALAARLSVRPTKTLGQNFVIDGNTVRKIVRTAGVGADDVVVEVGPGLGSLTLALLPEVRRVVAVEIDPVLAAELPATVAAFAPEYADRLEVVAADALRVDALPGPPPTALVANLPYNVSVPVLLHLLERFPSLRRVLVMVQAEVADRLAARAGLAARTACRASRRGGTPRSAGPARWGARCSGRRPASTPAWSRWCAATRRRPRPPARRSSPSSTPPSPSGARPCARPWRAGPARRPRPRPSWWRPGVDPGARGEQLDVAAFARIAEAGARGPPLGSRAVSRQAVTARVPAKVNLQLSVGALRPDGYHDLVTVFQAVGLYDDVVARPGSGLTLTAEGEGVDAVPLDETNLAARAARLLAADAGVAADVALHLRKGIPVAGGMAGGSADAAGALLACDALWGLRSDRSDLLALAGRLGADVPFALMGGTAVGVGRGDRLTPALARGGFHWVFALADGGLSTPAVFGELDRLRAGAGAAGAAGRRRAHAGAARGRRGRPRPGAVQRPAARRAGAEAPAGDDAASSAPNAGPSARWSRAPGRPAPSSRATRSTPSISRSR